MNLLRDPWVPVRDAEGFRHVSLADVLCEERDWRISLPRDDMEMAALQLAVCLTQTILTPATAQELRARDAEPLARAEYDHAAAEWLDLFDLCHPTHPFMQTASVKVTKKTAIQKLFLGMPNDASSSDAAQAFFNQTNEVSAICLPCAAVAVFQQATNGFSLGGAKFMTGLKGSVPVTTLIHGKALRKSLWRNVLTMADAQVLLPELPQDQEANWPTWKSPVHLSGTGKTLDGENTARIGMVRGLFWQPARIRLSVGERHSTCEHCGLGFAKYCDCFLAEPEAKPYRLRGFWRHPHTPIRYVEYRDQEKNRTIGLSHLKVDAKGMFWNQMSGYFWASSDGTRPGECPAPVVAQHRTVWHGQKIALAVGGYVAERGREKIERRSHEMYALGDGWESMQPAMRKILEVVEGVQDALAGAVDVTSKKLGHDLLAAAEALYLARTEPEIHARLRDIPDWREAARLREDLKRLLVFHAEKTYEEAVAPYANTPTGFKAAVAGEKVLRGKLRPYREEHGADSDTTT